MWLEALQLAAGVVLLAIGAYGVVEAGSALARRMGISPLWIGLTVVAIGTSLPELVVSVLASWGGSGEIAVGNVAGSNVLNVLIVLGATAMLVPLKVRRVTLRRDLGLVVAIGLGVWLLAWDGELHRGEGLLLLLATIPFLVHVYRQEKRGWIPAVEPPRGLERLPLKVLVPVLVLGLAALAGGGHFMVQGGTGLARTIGISERVIALTVVAIGTSLPELVTSLVAAARREVDMALGNVAGSNILNLLLVLGASALVAPLTVTQAMVRIDLPFMVLVSLLLVRFAATRGRISRVEGALLLALYGAYVAVLLGFLLRG